MTRTRMALTMTTLGLTGVLGLTACGAGVIAAPAAVAAGVADEAAALQAVGFETGLGRSGADAVRVAAAGRPPGGEREARRHAARKFLRKNTLHGEMTVQGKDSVQTVVVQRGTVDRGGRQLGGACGPAMASALTWTLGATRCRIVQGNKEQAEGQRGQGGRRDRGGRCPGLLGDGVARLIAVQ